MKKFTALSCAALLSLSISASPQRKPVAILPSDMPPPADSSRDNDVLVTIQGCVRGSPPGRRGKSLSVEIPYGEWRPVDAGAQRLGAVDLELEGQRNILTAMRDQFWGHLVEITGVVIMPDDRGPLPRTPIDTRRPVTDQPTTARGASGGLATKVRLKVERMHNIQETCNRDIVNR